MAYKYEDQSRVRTEALLIRFTVAEKKELIRRAKRRGCNTLAQYIRLLIGEDDGRNKVGVFDVVV
jgi:hypothetical protein